MQAAVFMYVEVLLTSNYMSGFIFRKKRDMCQFLGAHQFIHA